MALVSPVSFVSVYYNGSSHGDELYYYHSPFSPVAGFSECGCYPPGTYRRSSDDTGPIECDADNGECTCQFNVEGRQCDQCLEGHWNIDSGNGCERCECNRIGSYNGSCDVKTGQCHCKPGVGGLRCDQCMQQYFGFSYEGCQGKEEIKILSPACSGWCSFGCFHTPLTA